MKGTMLAQGIAKDELYKLLSQEESIHSSSVQLSEPISMMSIISSNNNVTSVQASNIDFRLESKSLKAHMLGRKDCNTPISVADKLQKDKGRMFEYPSPYRSIVGSLQYLTLTIPDIAFTVNKLSRFLAAPTNLHWQTCKRVLRYLQSIAHVGLQFFNLGLLTLKAYSNANWGSDPYDRRYVRGYCVYLGSNLLSWSFKKHNIVSRSTVESEYRALTLTTSEIL
ncbi:secreted RxLR effector protein 161-like [Citrus sinensis]|uniref:secreted RxLR effector protein 161-like n=1 Tax=Citrus sinensis TaxID=2711 RepID=UPI002278D4CE|nr:secreted RxLR effector protein 161-like [Citrus sinensis]